MPRTFFHKSNTKKSFIIGCEGDLKISFRPKKDIQDETIDYIEKNYSRIEVKLSYKQENSDNLHDPVKLLGVDYKIKSKNENNLRTISIISTNPKNNEFAVKNISSAKVLAKYLIDFRNYFNKVINNKNSESKKEVDLEDLARMLINSKFVSPRFNNRGLPYPDFGDKKLTIFESFPIYWSAAMDTLNSPILEIFSNIQHIAGLRNSPQRYYSLSNARSYVGKNGENTATLLYKQIKNLKVINSWFKLLEIPYNISISPINDNLAGSLLIIKLVDLRNKVELTPSDVGLGVSQVLPLLVQGLADTGISKGIRPRNRIRCVEQPELHLHPRLQANLADFFIDTTKRNSGLRWILETHSESLILRIQRRIREQKLKPEDVSINYVNSIKGGFSVVSELRLDVEGDFIDEWPNGFFEESFKERFQVNN